jgi:hypothetical protein
MAFLHRYSANELLGDGFHWACRRCDEMRPRFLLASGALRGRAGAAQLERGQNSLRMTDAACDYYFDIWSQDNRFPYWDSKGY